MNILFTYKKNVLKGGLLYNRPAVDDPRQLAPENWRIANLDDYMDIITFYGGEALAGADLKALNKWTDPNTGATAESIFKALPAGQRDTLGAFSGVLVKTVFWIK